MRSRLKIAQKPYILWSLGPKTLEYRSSEPQGKGLCWGPLEPGPGSRARRRPTRAARPALGGSRSRPAGRPGRQGRPEERWSDLYLTHLYIYMYMYRYRHINQRNTCMQKSIYTCMYKCMWRFLNFRFFLYIQVYVFVSITCC